MGSILYDFLNESFLFSSNDIENNFASYAENEIENELDKYGEFVLSNSIALSKEIDDHQGELKVFLSVENQSIQYLTQTALYVDQFIIQDPLIKHRINQTAESRMIGKHVGVRPL